jgi:hypothetical protein
MRDFFEWFVGDSAQRTQSFLRTTEKRLICSLVDEIPACVNSVQLSCVGALGALAAAATIVATRDWPNAIVFLPLAMTVNWFGFSVDLPLARRRGGEAPADGMAHHLGELFSHLVILLAYGFSPFFTLRSATVVIVCYLLFSVYGYIRAAIRHVDQMAYIGIGVTEFRILLTIWPVAATLLGVPDTLTQRAPPIDLAIATLAGFAVIGLIVKLFLDGRRIAAASGQED